MILSKSLWNHFSNEINLLIISELFSPLIKIITYLLALTLVLYYRKYGYKHSTAIPILWLSTVFIASIDLYHILSNTTIDVLSAVFKSLEVFGLFLILIISCLKPRLTSFESINSESDPKCPMTEYNVFSRIFFLWVTRIIRIGYKTNKDLMKHFLPLCPSIDTKSSTDAFESADKKYNSNRGLTTKRLLLLIWCTIWYHFVMSLIWGLFVVFFKFIQPYFLSKLIDFVSGADHYRWHGIYYAIAFCLFNVLARLSDSFAYLYVDFVSFRVRSALTSAVYKKVFKLSPDSRREYTTGLKIIQIFEN